MMRIVKILSTLFVFIILLVSCKDIEKNEHIFEQQFDENEKYTGFTDLCSEYKLEDAKKDGYYTELDSKVYENPNVWEVFVESSSKGEEAFVRIVHFYTDKDSTGPYFLDLYYNDGYYYVFDSSSDNLEKEKYLYLLTLEGRDGIPEQDTSITILTNNNELTFGEFRRAMYSSDYEVSQSIMPYEWIMFK